MFFWAISNIDNLNLCCLIKKWQKKLNVPESICFNYTQVIGISLSITFQRLMYTRTKVFFFFWVKNLCTHKRQIEMMSNGFSIWTNYSSHINESDRAFFWLLCVLCAACALWHNHITFPHLCYMTTNMAVHFTVSV